MKTLQLALQATLSVGVGLAGFLAAPAIARAQIDTFDNYATVASFTNVGWVLSQIAPGLVTTTFPAVGAGKGLRLQVTPLAGEAPAVAIWYRTTEYTNFYLAADLVSWAPTNQAVALLARGTMGDDPGSSTGYLVNYNAMAFGDAPTNPVQGELQVSVLNLDFSATQLAIGEVTLEPGRPYRIVFIGAGFHFTVRVYDYFDMTKPLIQMEADDPDQTYASGVCGLMAFNRDDALGPVDVTLDNYEIATDDPNPATPPALALPVSGTPTVETRIPASRFGSFYDPSGDLSFTVNTYTSNIINGTATKLRLNGVDMSNRLEVSPNGTNISITLPASALAAHTIYSAQLEVQDTTGQKRSTNTFWFDTFSDVYLASTDVKVIEAEDYNYSNGLYQLDPIPVSGPDTNGNILGGAGIGYFDLRGTEGVDFHDTHSTPEQPWVDEFRHLDAVGLAQGMYPEIQDANDPDGEVRYSDIVRSQYATNNMLEFVVHRTAAGEWLNYTRNFDGGTYNVWLRVASLGATTAQLGRVTSDPTKPLQSVATLGKFSIPNQFTRYNYRYLPLLDDAGAPVVVNLSGLNTLRLTFAGSPGQDDDKLAVNYLLFVPTAPLVRLYSAATLAGPFTQDPGAIVDASNRAITVPVSGPNRFYRLNSATALQINQIQIVGGIVTIAY